MNVLFIFQISHSVSEQKFPYGNIFYDQAMLYQFMYSVYMEGN